MTTVPEIRRIRAGEWQDARTLRLEALADPVAATAFLESQDEAARRPPGYWQTQTAEAAGSDDVAQFVAVLGGRLVATATAKRQDAGEPDYFGRVREEPRVLIVAVYVSPAARGAGTIDRLLDACAAWAAERGLAEVTLDVHGENARAEAAYRRAGFARTGVSADGPNGVEFEMRRR